MGDRQQMGRLNRAAAGLLSLLAAGLLLATIAGLLGRFWWVADLFSHFPVYYFLGLLVVVSGAAVLRRKRLLAVALVGLAVNAWALWPYFAPLPSQRAAWPAGDRTVLRLALVNVRHINRDSARVLAHLRGIDADLVFIQEVDPWWDGVLKTSRMPYRVEVSIPGEGSFGIALLVRDHPDASPSVRLIETRVDDYAVGFDGSQRPVIEATVQVDGRVVRVLSIHPPPPVSAELWALRDNVLRRAKAWAEEQTDPHVILGDLNTSPWSHAFSILEGDGGLVSTQLGRGNQGTWPATLPVPWLLPIDHCLHSPQLVCRDRRVGPDVGSDHLPLTLSLSLTSDENRRAGPIPQAYLNTLNPHK